MASRIVVTAMVLAARAATGGCSIFGSGTANSASASSNELGPEETGGIGVNAYLWRASLDTLDFMPLASADPWGGVIVTDWYANPAKPDERFKVTVYILDTRLRADGVSAAVFKETNVSGTWTTASVSPDTNIAFENAILSKARELRLSNIDG
ncbi:MAG: DUF3576 domain-containing protein [Alphaproteobacteria bacterium]|nr:DUF3576 domain-containing protein [Alphaproteobacteria bacterium]